MTHTETKDRPILFGGEMVRAILDGRKTQTRRIVKPQPKIVHAVYSDGSIETERIFRSGDQRIHCPYGKPGDRLWVRQTWAQCECGYVNTQSFRSKTYCAACDQLIVRWQPSIHMRREDSRITLEITNVRVEQLQEISEADAIAEGISSYESSHPEWDGDPDELRKLFRELWDSINGKRAPWESNPWVWVIEFKRVQP